MKDFVVISYYTRNTPYEEEVKGLRRSLEKYSLTYDIQGVDHLGDWQRNTTFKASFILKMLKKHAPNPIVWMDADSVLLSNPIYLSMIDADAAFYFRTDGGRVPRIAEDCELISATMLFNQYENTEKLLNMWIEENNKNDRDLEQHVLQRVLPKWRKEGGIMALLPQTYCKIFDSSPDHTVIVQNQASRRFRAAVGG